MSNFTAVFDDCVLYRESLRNLLVRMALTGLFRARWSERIHDEWTAALLKARPDVPPLTVEQLFDSYLRHELATTVSLLRPHADLL